MDVLTAQTNDLPGMSRRQRQTLQRLLLGESEKEAAAALHISYFTLHGYVRALYRVFCVNSRAELLAKYYRESMNAIAADRSPQTAGR